jgi:hypothetical protein
MIANDDDDRKKKHALKAFAHIPISFAYNNN